MYGVCFINYVICQSIPSVLEKSLMEWSALLAAGIVLIINIIVIIRYFNKKADVEYVDKEIAKVREDMSFRDGILKDQYEEILTILNRLWDRFDKLKN